MSRRLLCPISVLGGASRSQALESGAILPHPTLHLSTPHCAPRASHALWGPQVPSVEEQCVVLRALPGS